MSSLLPSGPVCVDELLSPPPPPQPAPTRPPARSTTTTVPRRRTEATVSDRPAGSVLIAEVRDPDRDAAVTLEVPRGHADADLVEAPCEEHRPVLVGVHPGAHRPPHGRGGAVAELQVLPRAE